MADVLLTLLPSSLFYPHTPGLVSSSSPVSLGNLLLCLSGPVGPSPIHPRKSEHSAFLLQSFPDQQRQHPLGTGEKCKFSGHVPDLLIQHLQGRAQRRVL